MHSSVEIRSAEVAENPDLVNERGDVFTRLVAANENDGKYTLSEDEVVRQLTSNLFPLPPVLSPRFADWEHLHADVRWSWYPVFLYLVLHDLSRMMIRTETTASVLKATLGYLGIHQDEQAKCYEEITSTIPRGQNPVRD